MQENFLTLSAIQCTQISSFQLEIKKKMEQTGVYPMYTF